MTAHPEDFHWIAQLVYHLANRCYTASMPTTLIRHSITETIEIAQAVDSGQALWPQASRADVVRHLIVLGAQTARQELAGREAMVESWAGFLPEAYPRAAAAQLKDEWPE